MAAQRAAVDEAAWKSRGRIRQGKDGPVFVIRKQVAGRRYEIALAAKTLEQALGEYVLFERDPVAYEKQARAVVAPAAALPETSKEPVYLDADLAEDFLAWSLRPKKDGGRGNSRRWVHEQKLYLDWWQSKLAGVDLRRATYRRHFEPALDGVPAYRHRVAVILALYRWLRRKKDFDLDEDPVHGRFDLPDPTPEQATRNKAVPLEHFKLVLGHIVGVHRDLLLLQGDTGMHVSEAWRFAGGGAIEPLPKNAQDDGAAGIVVIPWHKSSAHGGKEPLRVRVNAVALEAAKRILKHGPFSERRYCQAVKAACKAAGLAEDAWFGPGQMRHSVATYSVDGGEDPGAVSSSFGHRSKKTLRKFYATHAAPKKIRTLVDALAEPVKVEI